MLTFINISHLSYNMSKTVQLECNGATHLLTMQVPQDMTRKYINQRVSEAIGLPSDSFTLSYLDDLTSAFENLSVPEDYISLAYIALYKGLCLSVSSVRPETINL